MYILVTGASGYIGETVCLTLRRAGHTVTGVVRNADSPVARFLRQNEVGLLPADLNQPNSYREAIVNTDAIIHTVLDHANPIGTDNTLLATLKAVAAASPRSRLLIYTTGCSIYGKRPEYIMDENTPGNPASPLAFRMAMEQEVLQLTGYRKVILRPGFMYGKDGRSSMSGRWMAQRVGVGHAFRRSGQSLVVGTYRRSGRGVFARDGASDGTGQRNFLPRRRAAAHLSGRDAGLCTGCRLHG